MPRRRVNARARSLPSTATAAGVGRLSLFWLDEKHRRMLHGRRWVFGGRS